MCENCEAPPPEIVEAYEEFEKALTTFFKKTDTTDGITVDWVLVASQSIMHDNGMSSTMTAWMARLDQPAYRTKGLMHEVLDCAFARDIAHQVRDH